MHQLVGIGEMRTMGEMRRIGEMRLHKSLSEKS
jgi:hypothetical protein